MSEAKLKVGDRIYAMNHSSIVDIYTVNRVTATQAVTDKNVRFKIAIGDNGIVSEITSQSWYNTRRHAIESDELKAKLKRQNMLGKISGIDWTKHADETLSNVLKIIDTL